MDHHGHENNSLFCNCGHYTTTGGFLQEGKWKLANNFRIQFLSLHQEKMRQMTGWKKNMIAKQLPMTMGSSELRFLQRQEGNSFAVIKPSP